MTQANTGDEMLRMITGKWVSQAIYAVAELGIADLLAGGARSTHELARATGTHADALYRLLRAVSALGVFAEGQQREFRNTALGETLRSDVPGSLRSTAQFVGMDIAWKAWGEILHSVRTGCNAFEHVAGEPTFEYFGKHPAEAAILNNTMTRMSERESHAVVKAYDFSGARTIVDVGGGHGQLLAEILQANTRAKGILFELPHVVEGARKLFAERDLTQRATVVAGDAFQSVCPGGDVYILKRVIHNWDDDRAVQLIGRCAAAMPAGGRLLIVELVLPGPGVPHFAKWIDLEMLLMTEGGRERTAEEYQRLCSKADLGLTHIYATEDAISVIEGRR